MLSFTNPLYNIQSGSSRTLALERPLVRFIPAPAPRQAERIPGELSRGVGITVDRNFYNLLIGMTEVGDRSAIKTDFTENLYYNGRLAEIVEKVNLKVNDHTRSITFKVVSEHTPLENL